MTTNVQQGTLLDVLKKKMRQTKEEMEKYKDECEEYQKRLQVEIMRREEVSRRRTRAGGATRTRNGGFTIGNAWGCSRNRKITPDITHRASPVLVSHRTI